MTGFRRILVWAALAMAVAVPVAVAASSPLLAYRSAVYVGAGLAGVLALALLLVQPLLARGVLPGVTPWQTRRAHRTLGASLVALVLLHVGGLWLTSPPDMVDALLFASPTPFSAWGVIAMWALVAAAALAAARRHLRLPPRTWRRAHATLAAVVVAGSVLHALLIEGTMGPVSKAALCLLVLAATVPAVAGPWRAAAPPPRRA